MHVYSSICKVIKMRFFSFIFFNRKYNLRKVMVNGDIPRRVKKDAHAVILEFIRSRPPLRKVGYVNISIFFSSTFFNSFYWRLRVFSTLMK